MCNFFDVIVELLLRVDLVFLPPLLKAADVEMGVITGLLLLQGPIFVFLYDFDQN